MLGAENEAQSLPRAFQILHSGLTLNSLDPESDDSEDARAPHSLRIIAQKRIPGHDYKCC